MRSTVYLTATSLDGYIADADNSLDWLFEVAGGDDPGSDVAEFMAGVGAMAMGATTYEWLVAYERDHEGTWRGFHGETPCWVFTHRELPRIPGAVLRFVQGDVAPVHAEMARAAGDRRIWLAGGGELVGRFADLGLLDEIRLSVAPVMLGAGAPLLPRRLTGSRLELVEVARRGAFAELVYRVGPPAARPGPAAGDASG